MRTYLVPPVLVLVALGTLGGLVTSDDAPVGEDYNRRITPTEREEAFRRLEARTLTEEPICEPSLSRDANDPTYPPLPKSFISQLEFSMKHNKTVYNGEEMFEGLLNTGVLRYRFAEGIFETKPNIFEEDYHYSIPSDETLYIMGNNACKGEGGEDCESAKFCLASNMIGLDYYLESLFGFHDLNPDQGYMGATGILQWGPEHGYKYAHDINCRGMQCQLFETCIKVDDSDNRILILYYWSSPDWKLNTQNKQVPVAIEFLASGPVSPITTRPVSMRYDFYNFLMDVRPAVEALEPPVDTYCYGRKSKVEPPVGNHFFSFKSETVVGFDIEVPDGDNQTTTVHFTTAINQEEFYDWDQKVATSKYVPWFLTDEENRYEYTTLRVQDFNQGLHYSMQNRLGTCTIRIIENITSIGDVIVGDDGSVEMLPPWSFLDLDEPLQYNGEHWTRGIMADIWIGMKERLDLQILNESYVWYHASPFMADEDAGLRTNRIKAGKSHKKPLDLFTMDRTPVRLEKYRTLFAGQPHTIYNIYEYIEEPPLTHIVDISPCYTEDKISSYVFDIPKDSLEIVKNLRDKLLYAIQTVLAEFGVVSPLRINRLVLEERSDAIRVIFSILDKPNIEGDAPGVGLESNMEKAAELIDKALSKSQIVIIVPILDFALANAEEPEIVTIIPISKSLTSIARESTNVYTIDNSERYSSGSMAGLAIGMLITGAVIGIVLSMVVKIGSSASGGLPRVSVAKNAPASMTRDSVYLGADVGGGSDI